MDVLTQRAQRGTQRARRDFANFASEPFATFALKRGVWVCFNAKNAEGTQRTRRGFANFALKNEDGIGIKEMNS